MPHYKKRQSASYMALVAGVFFTGISAVLIKMADAPGVVTAFYRMAIGSAALIIPFIYSRLKKPSPLPLKGVFYAVVGGLFFAIDMAMWATGIVATNATIPTMAANLAPAWAALGAIWLFGEHPRRGFWVGLVISFLGVFVMVGNDFTQSSGMLNGILLGLGAGMFYGFYYLVAQKGRELISTISYLSISTFTSAAVLLLFMFVTSHPFTGYSNSTWIIFLVYGIGVQVIGWWMINFAQGYLRATIVAPSLLGQPVVTVIGAYFILHENHTIYTLLGGLVVIGGIYLVHLSRPSK